MRKFTAFVMALCLVSGLACAAGAEGKLLGYTCMDGTNPFFVALEGAIKEVVEAHGYQSSDGCGRLIKRAPEESWFTTDRVMRQTAGKVESKASTAAVPCFAMARLSRLAVEVAPSSAAAQRESAEKDVDKSPPTQKAEADSNRD